MSLKNKLEKIVMLPEDKVKENLYNFLIDMVEHSIKERIETGYSDDEDTSIYVWETILESFYGDDIFEKLK